MSEVKSKLLLLTLSVVGMIILFTAGLCYFEDWPLFTSLWIAVVSLTTTGYGELVPTTAAGKIFTMFMLMTGIGLVLYFLSTAISLIVENNFTMFMERDKTMEQIKRLENHVIVCGAGRVGSNAANILKNYQVPYVLIDIDEALVKQAIEDGHLILLGDATRDEILIKAGIQKARGIICALSGDTLNVFVALSSRSLNPQLKIVARSAAPETVAKLRQAGADKVISPTQLGGSQMAMAMIKPAAVEMVDTLFAYKNLEIQLEEVEIDAGSWLANKPINEAFNRNSNNVMVAAIIRDQQVNIKPGGHDILMPGDTLVLIGSRQDLDTLDYRFK